MEELDQRAVIFGGASGIANATVRLLVAAYPRMVLVAREEGQLSAFAEELRRMGAVEVVCRSVADITGADLEAGVDLALIAYGRMGQPMNAAGLAEAMRDNVQIVAEAFELVRPYLRDGARVGIITSVAGERARLGAGAYGIAKVAVSAYASVLRQSGFRFSITEIRPGPVFTKMTAHLDRSGPLWATPEQVAAGIVRALQSRKAVARVPWLWNPVMSIVRLLPERLLAKLGHDN